MWKCSANYHVCCKFIVLSKSCPFFLHLALWSSSPKSLSFSRYSTDKRWKMVFSLLMWCIPLTDLQIMKNPKMKDVSWIVIKTFYVCPVPHTLEDLSLPLSVLIITTTLWGSVQGLSGGLFLIDIEAYSDCQRDIAKLLCFEFIYIRSLINCWQAVGLHAHFKNQRLHEENRIIFLHHQKPFGVDYK